MAGTNEMGSVEGQLVGLPLAGPESFTIQQLAYLRTALNLGSWEDVSAEANYNTAAINVGGFNIKYNPALNLVTITADVQVKAGELAFFTWSNRLKPVFTSFALGQGLNIYISQTGMTQPSSATQRWINGVWTFPVVGGN